MEVKLEKLEDRIGQKIAGFFPSLSEEVMKVTLHAVEGAGVWIEYPEFTEKILEASERSAIPCTPVMFLPFERVGWILGYVDERPAARELGGNVVPVHFGNRKLSPHVQSGH